jgi:hypothetical protein
MARLQHTLSAPVDLIHLREFWRLGMMRMVIPEGKEGSGVRGGSILTQIFETLIKKQSFWAETTAGEWHSGQCGQYGQIND